MLLGLIVFTSLYVLPKMLPFGLFVQKVCNKDGNAIPDGPVGLPIVGKMRLLGC